MIHLVTFSDESMSRSRELCIRSARGHGVEQVREFSPAEPCTERGCGFWRWKPRIIDYVLSGLDPFVPAPPDKDIVIYADAGVEFVDRVDHIIDRMDQDIFLFGNNYEHAHWCKRDIIEAIFPSDNPPFMSKKPWEDFGKQVQASVIFFRVSDYTRAFVKEWLHYCLLDNGRLIDDSKSKTPNHTQFQENRHDQAILTTLAYRDGLKLHWWPAEYNNGAFVYEKLPEYAADNYPILFHHHRKRNSEWT